MKNTQSDIAGNAATTTPHTPAPTIATPTPPTIVTPTPPIIATPTPPATATPTAEQVNLEELWMEIRAMSSFVALTDGHVPPRRLDMAHDEYRNLERADRIATRFVRHSLNDVVATRVLLRRPQPHVVSIANNSAEEESEIESMFAIRNFQDRESAAEQCLPRLLGKVLWDGRRGSGWPC